MTLLYKIENMYTANCKLKQKDNSGRLLCGLLSWY